MLVNALGRAQQEAFAKVLPEEIAVLPCWQIIIHENGWFTKRTDEHVLTLIISIDIRVVNNISVFGHASQAVGARESANRCDLGVVGEFPWFLESCT